MTEPTGWTDHDVPDPGITLLEALVYVVGAMGLATATVAFIRARRDSRNAGGS